MVPVDGYLITTRLWIGMIIGTSKHTEDSFGLRAILGQGSRP
jgi:hypothetical protein